MREHERTNYRKREKCSLRKRARTSEKTNERTRAFSKGVFVLSKKRACLFLREETREHSPTKTPIPQRPKPRSRKNPTADLGPPQPQLRTNPHKDTKTKQKIMFDCVPRSFCPHRLFCMCVYVVIYLWFSFPPSHALDFFHLLTPPLISVH